MDLGLAGRVALVTGASRGIGRGIAEALAAEGARVAVASRSLDQLEDLAAAIGGRAYEFDSDDLDAVEPLVDAVERDLGPIDVYVANTGGPPPDSDPLAIARADWEAAQRTILLSPMAFLARLIPGMRERGFGRVLAIASTSAREPLDGLQLSNAHRPGLLAALKHLARQTAADGVTINAILPGQIATDRSLRRYSTRAEADAAAAREVPAGRLGEVDELAAAAAFLCSERASYITGQSLQVDGGLTRSW